MGRVGKDLCANSVHGSLIPRIKNNLHSPLKNSVTRGDIHEVVFKSQGTSLAVLWLEVPLQQALVHFLVGELNSQKLHCVRWIDR